MGDVMPNKCIQAETLKSLLEISVTECFDKLFVVLQLWGNLLTYSQRYTVIHIWYEVAVVGMGWVGCVNYSRTKTNIAIMQRQISYWNAIKMPLVKQAMHHVNYAYWMQLTPCVRVCVLLCACLHSLLYSLHHCMPKLNDWWAT